ncbi:hypothetical protein [Bacteroides faecis]|uniref:hypothetical protein n=1 Tax=Bacteroides faecis TaxID=674529 RepID=UPI001E2B12F3|nr:hypothetical protein [Bacteroides faecis]
MPDNTFILKKLPNVSELSLIFITQIIVMNMLATIAILESIFTISYNISDKKRFKIQDYRFIKDFIKDKVIIYNLTA